MAACPDAGRVLSLGCATGDELVSLRKRFPLAEIVGVDINAEVLSVASLKAASDGNMLTRSNTTELEEETFDLIFCLSVLCSYPLRRSRPKLPFDIFEKAVVDVVRLLAPGGYLVVYNAQYLLDDVPDVRLLLQPCWKICRHPSTFVTNFPVFRAGRF